MRGWPVAKRSFESAAPGRRVGTRADKAARSACSLDRQATRAGDDRPALGDAVPFQNENLGMERDGRADVPRDAEQRVADRKLRPRAASRGRDALRCASRPSASGKRGKITRGCGISAATALCPRSRQMRSGRRLADDAREEQRGGLEGQVAVVPPVAGVPKHRRAGAAFHGAARVDAGRSASRRRRHAARRSPARMSSSRSSATGAKAASQSAVRAARSGSWMWPS